MSIRVAPQTARQARLLRLANTLSRRGTPGAPTSETEKQLWAKSHERREADIRLSAEEERLRKPMLPTTTGENAMSTHRRGDQNLYQYRAYPMYPGEYIPPEHNSMASVRDALRADLTAQSIKDAWFRVSNGKFYQSAGAFYAAKDGLNEHQLGDIVHALFPDLTGTESRAMVRRVLEAITSPEQTTARSVAASVSADSLGLDAAPGHYTNFLQWMSRIMSTKAFATERSIDQFCRRAFNRNDVQTMYENYHVLSPDAVRRLSSDGYSHFHAVLKDYSIKVAGADTRHQIGVRIDPAEVDQQTGFSFGFGKHIDTEIVCMLRPNPDGTGTVKFHGKPLNEYFGGLARRMERILAPMDEAGLDFKDWDVYFIDTMVKVDNIGMKMAQAIAGQFALATAISKALPLARIPLKKAGYLSFDAYRPIGDHPGFKHGRYRRTFLKRAPKGVK